MDITGAGDAAIVLRYGGSKGLAYGVHGATAIGLIITAGLILLA